MKNFFRDIHLYLSLAAGLVIALVCLTGAILVFEKEMQQTIYPERYTVTPVGQPVPLQKMVASFTEKVPGAKVAGIKIYTDPSRSVELSYPTDKPEKQGEGHETKAGRSEQKRSEKAAGVSESKNSKGEKDKKGEKGKGGKGNNSQAFMNPYTGELISLYTHRKTFFYTAFATHRWLLNEDIGKVIVGISTLFFLFILLTGIILWWPKNKKILKQRLTLKFDGSWKRINHDLHIVIGFYTAIFLFAFAFTGLAWSFKWFNDGIYLVTGTDSKQPEPPVSEISTAAQPITFDQAYAIAKRELPNVAFYNISMPKAPEDAISVNALPLNAVHERANTQLFLDQYSGKVLQTVRFEDKNLGQRVRATFYPIHVGSIGGLPGRIIALLSCIAGFTFPITGIIMWLNRLQKKKKKKVARKTVAIS